MEKLGTIVEIVGSSMVLIKSEPNVSDYQMSTNSVLRVFSEIRNDELSARHGLPALYVPKGEVRISAKQSGNFYLAEVFAGTIERTRVIEKPPSLLSGILAGHSTSETVKEQVPGPLSASLSKATVNVSVSTRVVVGDVIGTD